MKIPEKIDEFEKSLDKRLNENYKEIERNTRQIADDTSKAILDLNLPIRIDKLDANIAGISSAIQNIQGRLDSIERSIIEKVKDSSDKQMVALSAIQERLVADSAKTRRASQNSFIITWVIIVLCFVVFYFSTHKLE
jgi:uncharacterized protein YoxC